MFLYERLKKCREKKSLTQTDLMFELDKKGLRISRATLINWESGATIPSVPAVEILANFFGKPLMYFFNEKQPLTVGKNV